MDTIYVPNDGMQDAKHYKKKLTTLINQLNKSKKIDQTVSKLDDKLLRIMNDISADGKIKDQVKDRMLYDLRYANHIIEIYNNKYAESNPVQVKPKPKPTWSADTQ